MPARSPTGRPEVGCDVLDVLPDMHGKLTSGVSTSAATGHDDITSSLDRHIGDAGVEWLLNRPPRACVFVVQGDSSFRDHAGADLAVMAAIVRIRDVDAEAWVTA